MASAEAERYDAWRSVLATAYADVAFKDADLRNLASALPRTLVAAAASGALLGEGQMPGRLYRASSSSGASSDWLAAARHLVSRFNKICEAWYLRNGASSSPLWRKNVHYDPEPEPYAFIRPRTPRPAGGNPLQIYMKRGAERAVSVKEARGLRFEWLELIDEVYWAGERIDLRWP